MRARREVSAAWTSPRYATGERVAVPRGPRRFGGVAYLARSVLAGMSIEDARGAVACRHIAGACILDSLQEL